LAVRSRRKYLRRGVAREEEWPEKRSGWRKQSARERKALEKEKRWRKGGVREKEGPEKRSGQRNILERKGLFGVPGSRNGFLVCARLIPPEWPHLRRAVCLGHLSWAYLACQEISPQHPPPAGATLLSVPLSSALSLTRTSLLSLFLPRGLVLGHFPPNSFVLSTFSSRTFLFNLVPPSSLLPSFALCQDISLRRYTLSSKVEPGCESRVRHHPCTLVIAVWHQQ
jgi:hypothetical protein